MERDLRPKHGRARQSLTHTHKQKAANRARSSKAPSLTIFLCFRVAIENPLLIEQHIVYARPRCWKLTESLVIAKPARLLFPWSSFFVFFLFLSRDITDFRCHYFEYLHIQTRSFQAPEILIPSEAYPNSICKPAQSTTANRSFACATEKEAITLIQSVVRDPATPRVYQRNSQQNPPRFPLPRIPPKRPTAVREHRQRQPQQHPKGFPDLERILPPHPCPAFPWQ